MLEEILQHSHILIMAILMILLSRYAPKKTSLIKGKIDEERLALNEKRFRRYSFVIAFQLMGYVLFCSMVGWALYIVVSHFFKDSSATLYYGTEAGVGACAGMLVAFGTLMEFLEKKAVSHFGADYDLYIEHTDRAHEMDSQKVNVILQKILYPLVYIAIFLFVWSLGVYVKIKDDKLVIKYFLSFKSEEYKVSDVTRVEFFQKKIAPNGGLIDYPHYILFDSLGNKIYKTDNFSIRTDDKFIQFFEEKIKASAVKN